MIIVTGARGMLGSAVVRQLESQGTEHRALTRGDLDISDTEACKNALRLAPDGTVLINCAGAVGRLVDGHRTLTQAEYDTNAHGPHNLVNGLMLDAAINKRVIHISTDCVFDGKGGPYHEGSPVPADGLDAYGESKAYGEVTTAPHLTVRTSFIGFGDRGLLAWLMSQPPNAEITGYVDWLWNGWYVRNLATVICRLATSPDVTGLLHLGNVITTKYSLLSSIAHRLRPDIKVTKSLGGSRNMVLVSNRTDMVIPHPSFGNRAASDLVYSVVRAYVEQKTREALIYEQQARGIDGSDSGGAEAVA